jgi:nitroreductase
MLEPILDRRSVRKYTAEPVPEAAIRQILEAARLAPSGSNTQPWHFIVVRSEERRRAIAEVSHRQSWMLEAPVHIACVGDIRCRIADYSGPPLDENSALPELKQVIRDMAIAVEHLVLEATRLGLGTCWVAWFTQREIRSVLGVPDDKYVLAVVTVGHAAEVLEPRPRRALADMVHTERW